MIKFLEGDCRDVLPTLEAESVQCCVTSPPYWGLRDFGTNGQLGLEATPEEYIANMVAVFREVWRVLRKDGTCWINLGDSFLEKQLCLMPARLAMALQADGWYLRSDIIWHKSNPMPESVTDRLTKSHEYIFLLTKQERYFYDADAIREPHSDLPHSRECKKRGIEGDFTKSSAASKVGGWNDLPSTQHPLGRNKRSVWTVATQPYAEAHFATFPEEIPKLCILAGSRSGDVILDPFAGSGTVGKVAIELGRKAILIELNPVYMDLAEDRTNVTAGFF